MYTNKHGWHAFRQKKKCQSALKIIVRCGLHAFMNYCMSEGKKMINAISSNLFKYNLEYVNTLASSIVVSFLTYSIYFYICIFLDAQI